MGVVPTPAIAYAAEQYGWVGIAITASHNVWSDNGIKVFASGGAKLGDAEQIEIEREWHAMVSEPVVQAQPTIHDATGILGEYATHRLNVVGEALSGVRVVLDCANGAMSHVAPEVFMSAGADVSVINASPTGRNINDNCGATAPQQLAAQVIAEGADIGIAFDGDGDRLIAVAASGALVDGDHIMAIAAVDLAQRGLLRNKGVAVTVMTNLGFHHTMRDNNIDVVITPVGDRSILVALDEFDFVLGGEHARRDQPTLGRGFQS